MANMNSEFQTKYKKVMLGMHPVLLYLTNTIRIGIGIGYYEK